MASKKNAINYLYPIGTITKPKILSIDTCVVLRKKTIPNQRWGSYQGSIGVYIVSRTLKPIAYHFMDSKGDRHSKVPVLKRSSVGQGKKI